MSTRVAVRKILAVAGRVSKSQTSLPVFKLKVRSSGKIRAFSRYLDHPRKGLQCERPGASTTAREAEGGITGPVAALNCDSNSDSGFPEVPISG